MGWYSRKGLAWRLSNKMDEQGEWRDNRMTKRLRRFLKNECVCLNTFETASKMRSWIGIWLTDRNAERPYSINGSTPGEASASKT
jgi:putative transposase